MSVTASKKSLIWSIVVSTAFCLTSVWFVFGPLITAYQHKSTWTRAAATIEDVGYSRYYGITNRTQLIHHLIPQYQVRLRYVYAFGGKTYVGYAHKSLMISEARAEGFVGNFEGKGIEIAVDPQNPMHSEILGIVDFEGYLPLLVLSLILLSLSLYNYSLAKKNLWRNKAKNQ